MDRRTKHRIDLQLLCRLGAGALRSEPMEGVTENISRDGILMRWLAAVPLPVVGSRLTVEFVLQASEGFGQRMMRCRTTVVRIDGHEDGQSSVGMRIDGINFIPVTSGTPTPAELSAMPSVTERIN